MALKKFFPDVRFGNNKVDPDEINMRQNYQVIYPSIGTATVWAGKGTGDVAAVGTIVNATMDYPRNLLVMITGVAGGEGGTATISGKNQFGETQSESIGFATANAGGTKAGTLVFSEVTGATVNVVGLGGTAIGSIGIGYAFGTASGLEHKFGLPVRIQAVSDVKGLTWINNGAVTAINGGTLTTAHVGTAQHTFSGTAIVAATDIFNVSVLSTYNSETRTNVR